MTQTIEKTPKPSSPRNFECPEWCTAGDGKYPCRGEHTATSAGSHVPASGGHFARAEALDDAQVPLVAVGLYWAEAWGEGQELTVAIGEDGGWLSFKPGEALAFATEVAIMLQAMVQASGISVTDAERVLELHAMSKSLKSMLTKKVTS